MNRIGKQIVRWRFFLNGMVWTALLYAYGFTVLDWQFWPLNTAGFLTAALFGGVPTDAPSSLSSDHIGPEDSPE